MNFLSKLSIALMISFSFATPSNAWHSKMSMKEKAAWITVGGRCGGSNEFHLGNRVGGNWRL